MKVAIVAGPQFTIPPRKYGGAEQVIHNLITGLKELGHETVLLAAGDSKVDCQLIPIVDHAISIPKHRVQLPAYQRKLKRVDATMKRRLKQLLPEIDIIHSNGFDMLPFKDFPSLTTIHNRFVLDDMAYYKKRQSLLYVSISKNQQASFPDLSYLDVIYNGLDPEMFPFNERPDNYLCFLGRFDRDKNPHLAIQLAVALGMRIKVAGKIDYDSTSYFKEEIAKYLKHPLVEYVGELDLNGKVKLLSNAVCNLHPTGFREPFGLTVIEAAYCGTPTLAIRKGAMSELIEDGRTGVLVEDFIEGFHKIEKCFNMDRFYVAKRSRHLFNYKIMAKNYEQAYRTAIRLFRDRQKHEEIIKSVTTVNGTKKAKIGQ